ncbi:hypothetical protein CAPTEDRAFT_165173 [Capitella teleta]|uniref:Otopetrin n=1 Tax=Capitella teleta TaxID=283909 RepID=R7T6T3_CAPTE|nr:hypothetical protein CAPTEDRAFT_165173 [Capitella teleta]|eukprot:ELT89103.1 hypothetical protein CAPTEDRAFT_165173 [Capitella teleta]
MILIVFGLCLPLADIFSSQLEVFIFEGFYIYLHVVSVLFLLYVYCYILRQRKNPTKNSRAENRQNSLIDDLPAPKHPHQRFSMSCSSHTGSFYLRLGAIGFGVGAMIHEGLMLGRTLEYKMVPECIHVLTLVRPVIQLTFTFFQLYFIFLNSRMCIHKYRTLARFGLMHMVATNICVWLRVVIQETVHDIHRSQGHKGKVNKFYCLDFNFLFLAGNESVACIEQEIMGKVVENASPYLYPCTIEYSLIAAGILYIMWLNISKSAPTPSTPSDCGHLKKHLRMSVDCAGANRGLFFGIFTLVATIISLIIFFVLVDIPHLQGSAVMVVHVSELTLYCLALIAVIVASVKIRQLRFDTNHKDELDGILILISQMGVYVYSVFSIVAGRYGDDLITGIFTMATNALIMLQATVQTVFILNGLRRSPRSCFHERKKPGREFVTFLLVCNIGMWGINTFEVLRADSNPLALNYYGFLPWSIISHVATPLAIFYRFHSTVCLSAIWKNAYKMKGN